MTYLSVIDKIKILFSMIFDFKGIFVFSILMIIFTILYLLKKLSTKRYTIAMALSVILVILISVFTNVKVLSNTFDNFMTIFFTGIYFPSIYLYISTLVIVFASFLFSIINVRIRKVYKIINRVMFIVNNIIFVVILNIIAKNKIDIFSINSLYTDTNLVGLLEISMSVFLIWIASLIIAYVTNSICDKLAKKKEVKEEVVVKEVKETINLHPEKDYLLVENLNRKIDTIKIEEPKKSILSHVTSYIPKSISLVHNLAPYSYYEIDYDDSLNKKEKKESISIVDFVKKEKILPEVKTKKEGLTFDDILNGKVPVSYYDDNKEDTVYSISNPQEVYESHYNSVKLQDLVEETPNDNIFIKEDIIPEDNTIIEENNSVKEDSVIIEPSVEDITKEIKSKRAEENLNNNTISLNELLDDEVLEDVKVIDKVEEMTKTSYTDYTIEDYKKIIGMLNSLKKHSIDHNVTIDDAVAISLISNYSLDDCLKFKDILESTLN